MLALLAYPDAVYPDADSLLKAGHTDCILIRWPEVNKYIFRVFENLIWCIVKYTLMCLYIFVYINIIVYNYV